jgi:hypothetical protein
MGNKIKISYQTGGGGFGFCETTLIGFNLKLRYQETC